MFQVFTGLKVLIMKRETDYKWSPQKLKGLHLKRSILENFNKTPVFDVRFNKVRRSYINLNEKHHGLTYTRTETHTHHAYTRTLIHIHTRAHTQKLSR